MDRKSEEEAEVAQIQEIQVQNQSFSLRILLQAGQYTLMENGIIQCKMSLGA